MKKVFLILFLLILAGCDSSTPVSPNITIQPDNLDRDTLMEETDPELVDSLWEFTSLTQELLESEDNEVYSPLSLYLARSEEHTSELQSRGHLVCRLLLEKKNKYK